MNIVPRAKVGAAVDFVGQGASEHFGEVDDSETVRGEASVRYDARVDSRHAGGPHEQPGLFSNFSRTIASAGSSPNSIPPPGRVQRPAHSETRAEMRQTRIWSNRDTTPYAAILVVAFVDNSVSWHRVTPSVGCS